MKQVIIVRTDLKMGKGKIAAQCCHGSLGSYKRASSDKIKKWENEAYAKVVCKVSSLEELMELKKQVDISGIPNFLVVGLQRGTLFPVAGAPLANNIATFRSEEHTSELQSQ